MAPQSPSAGIWVLVALLSLVPPAVKLTSPQLKDFNLNFHITNRVFSSDLETNSSSAYQNLSHSIEAMCNQVYNCSNCSTASSYLGVSVVRFSNGSVIAHTVLHFDPSSNVSASRAATILNETLQANGSHLNGLDISNASVSTIVSTTVLPSTATMITVTPRATVNATSLPVTNNSTQPSSTTATTVPPVKPTSPQQKEYNLNFRMTNQVFSSDLENSSSSAFQNLSHQIAVVCNDVYNCSNCSTASSYRGVSVVRFSNGSVIAHTVLHFDPSSNVSASRAATIINETLQANGSHLNGLDISHISVSEIASTTVPPSTTTVTATVNATSLPVTNSSTQPSSTTVPPVKPTSPQQKEYNLNLHIQNQVFTSDLENSSSSAFQDLRHQIAVVCNQVYNCSNCSTATIYLGVSVVRFSNGSVIAHTVLHFDPSSNVSASRAATIINETLQANGSHLNGLDISHISVSEIASTTVPPSTTTVTATVNATSLPVTNSSTQPSSTTVPPVKPTSPQQKEYNLNLHIQNQVFTSDLENSSSSAFQDLSHQIAVVCNQVYNCSNCSTATIYLGVSVVRFSNGSVIAHTVLHFDPSSNVSASRAATIINETLQANGTHLNGLDISHISVSEIASTTVPPSTTTVTATVNATSLPVTNSSTQPSSTTVPPVKPTSPQQKEYNLNLHIQNQVFTSDLENSSSSAFQDLSHQIAVVCNQVYNCSNCSTATIYLGVSVVRFSNGSVIAHTVLHFDPSSNVSASRAATIINETLQANGTHLNGLDISHISVSEIASTTVPPSTTTVTATVNATSLPVTNSSTQPSSTTVPPVKPTSPQQKEYNLNLHIQKKVFTSDLENSSSSAFQDLSHQIAVVCNQVYNCSNCSTATIYLGVSVVRFSNGSVIAHTVLHFDPSSNVSASRAATIINETLQANGTHLNGLDISHISVSEIASTTVPPSTTTVTATVNATSLPVTNSSTQPSSTTVPPVKPTSPQQKEYNLNLHIQNQVFTSDLENSSSSAFQDLSHQIAVVCNQVYNCSNCSTATIYLGVSVVRFSNGSVIAHTVLHFDPSSSVSASRAATIINETLQANGSHLNGLDISHISVSEIASTTVPPSTTTVTATVNATSLPVTNSSTQPSSTTVPPVKPTSPQQKEYNLNLHIQNQVFTSDLENSSSSAFQDLSHQIAVVCNQVYNCSNCSTATIYLGVSVVRFSNGSVIAHTVLHFDPSSNVSASRAATIINETLQANGSHLNGLDISHISVSEIASTTVPPSTTTVTATVNATSLPVTNSSTQPSSTTVPPVKPTSPQQKEYNLNLHIQNQVFTSDLENSSSSAFQDLSHQIAVVCNQVYNCSNCSTATIYLGVSVVRFSNGSVIAHTVLHFDPSSNVSASRAATIINETLQANGSHLNGLDISHISVSEIASTTVPPSTTTVTATVNATSLPVTNSSTQPSSTTVPPVKPTSPQQKEYNLNLHIQNQVFTSDLENSSSSAFQDLSHQIAVVCNQVYNCSNCSTATIYLGVSVVRFSNGSVIAHTVLHFDPSSSVSASRAATIINETLQANGSHLNGLDISHISVSEIASTTVPPSTTTVTATVNATSLPVTNSSTQPSSTTVPPVKPTSPQQKEYNLNLHIQNQVFTSDLENSSSSAFQDLSHQIAVVCNQVYNCSNCSTATIYLGVSVVRFSNGSVIAHTVLHFDPSSNVSASRAATILNETLQANGSHLNGLDISHISVYGIASTTVPPSTATLTTVTPKATVSTAVTTVPPVKPTSPQQKDYNLNFRITNYVFSSDLANKSSSASQALSHQIEVMCNQVYNCSNCSTASSYLGVNVLEFSNGSVIAHTVLHFDRSSNVSSSRAATILNETLQANSSHLNGMDIANASVSDVISPTVPPSTVTAATVKPTKTSVSPSSVTAKTHESSSSVTPSNTSSTSSHVTPKPTSPASTATHSTGATSSTTKGPDSTPSSTPTTQSPANVVYLTFRITNQLFVSELNNPDSQVYKDLVAKVDTMCNDVYGCPKCDTRSTYIGVNVLSFSSGSVIANTKLNFNGNGETPAKVQSMLNTTLAGNGGSINGLRIDSVTVSRSELNSPPTSGPLVPGWGIALLVLVCFLVLLALLYILYLLLRLCRRNKKGEMEIFASRGSYHPMNEYPAYQTHTRYEAPGKKGTYEVQQSNGAYSYTNPAMESNNL
ncbi:mucin-1 [Ambystoma mexicanum]|uniref:mucin-1 n=1 Tax=Ambystoma mexicanum TaxID=8296 RepID=UPI0037E73D5D